MKRHWGALSLVVVLLAIGTFTRAASNQPVAAQSEFKTVTGELVKVDDESKTFTIKHDDEEIVFQYTEETKVEGKDNGVQGLLTETGVQLTVFYSEEDGKKLASKIEIKKSDG